MPIPRASLEMLQQQRRSSMSHAAIAAASRSSGPHRQRRASMHLPGTANAAAAAGKQRRASLQLLSYAGENGRVHFRAPAAAARASTGEQASLQLPASGMLPSVQSGSSSGKHRRASLQLLPYAGSGGITDSQAPPAAAGSGRHRQASLQLPSAHSGSSSGRHRRASYMLPSPLGRPSHQVAHAAASGDDDYTIHSGQQPLLQQPVVPLTGCWEVDSAAALAAFNALGSMSTTDVVSAAAGYRDETEDAACQLPAHGSPGTTVAVQVWQKTAVTGVSCASSVWPLSRTGSFTVSSASPRTPAAIAACGDGGTQSSYSADLAAGSSCVSIGQGNHTSNTEHQGPEQPTTVDTGSRVTEPYAATVTAAVTDVPSTAPHGVAAERLPQSRSGMPGHSRLARTASAAMAAAEHSSALDPAVSQRLPYGKVSLPGHSQLARTASTLLTGLILPERPVFAGLDSRRGSSNGFRPNRTASYGFEHSNLPSRNHTQDHEGHSWLHEVAVRRTGGWVAGAQPISVDSAAGVTGGALQLEHSSQSCDSCSLPLAPLALSPRQHLQRQPSAAGPVVVPVGAMQLRAGGCSIRSCDSCSLPLAPWAPQPQHHLRRQMSAAGPTVMPAGADSGGAVQLRAEGHSLQSCDSCSLPMTPSQEFQKHKITAASTLSESTEPWLPAMLFGPAHMQELLGLHSPGMQAAGTDMLLPKLALARRSSAGPMLVIGSHGEIGAAPLTAAVLRATQGGSRSSRVSLSDLAGVRFTRASLDLPIRTTGCMRASIDSIAPPTAAPAEQQQQQPARQLNRSSTLPALHAIAESDGSVAAARIDASCAPSLASQGTAEQQPARQLHRSSTLPALRAIAESDRSVTAARADGSCMPSVAGQVTAEQQRSYSTWALWRKTSWTEGQQQEQQQQQQHDATGEGGIASSGALEEDEPATTTQQPQGRRQHQQQGRAGRQQCWQPMLANVRETRSLHLASLSRAAGARYAAQLQQQHDWDHHAQQAGLLHLDEEGRSAAVANSAAAATGGQLLHPSAFLTSTDNSRPSSIASVVTAVAGTKLSEPCRAISALTEALSSALDDMPTASSGKIPAYWPELAPVGSGSLKGPAAGYGLQRLVSASSCGLSMEGSLPAPDNASSSSTRHWTLGTTPGLPGSATATGHRSMATTNRPCDAAVAGGAAVAASPCDSSWSCKRSGADGLADDDDDADIGPALLVIPTESATIFEASIAARPNFDDRELPPSNSWYMGINGLILLLLVCGAVIELVTGTALH